MKKLTVLFIIFLCCLEIKAAMPRESIRILGLDSELAGIITDPYTDIFTINPYYIRRLDSKMLIVEPNRLDFNGQPKLLIGRFTPHFGFAFNIGNSKSPGTVQSVTWGTLDLDNNFSSDQGNTSGETLQKWDDGFVPAPGRGSAIVAGGTTNDRIFDRSKKTFQSGEYYTYANEFNYARISKLFGMPTLTIIEYQGRTIPSNASKIEEDKNDVTGEIIKRQTTIRRETSANIVGSLIYRIGHQLIKSEKKHFGLYLGITGKYQQGIPVLIVSPSGSSFWLGYDKDSKTAINNDWNLSISTGALDNYNYQTQIKTQTPLIGAQIGNDYSNQISDKTKVRGYFNIGYATFLFGTGTINNSLSDAGVGGGISTLSGNVSEGTMYDWVSAGDIYTISNNERISNKISQTETNIDTALGIETSIKKNLLLASGIKLSIAESKIDVKSTQSLMQNSRYDQNGDNDFLDTGDREKTVSDSNEFTTMQNSSNYTLSLPAGFEIKALEWLTFRMGARHVIKYYKTETTGEITADSLQVTTTRIGNGTIFPTETITYSNTTTTKTPGNTVQETIDQDNYINAGFGLNFGDNISLDVKMSTNADIMNLGSWYISGIYKF